MGMSGRLDWKCGNCGKLYSTIQLIGLNSVKVVEEDTNPSEQHGYTSVCECGYRFHIDTWRLRDTVTINTEKGDVNVDVSTVFLELNNGWKEGKDLWYESMIFPQEEWLKCGYQNRYETKEEAIKDHDKILDMLRTGKYKLEKIYDDESESNMELIIDGSEDKYDVVYSLIKALRRTHDKEE